jgi:ABC-type molybdate transport system ATPase subunit
MDRLKTVVKGLVLRDAGARVCLTDAGHGIANFRRVVGQADHPTGHDRNVVVTTMYSVRSTLDDVRAMPMGFHTLIGDMGTVLSGGKKQRVLFARCTASPGCCWTKLRATWT